MKETKDVSTACGSGADPFCSDQLYGQAVTFEASPGIAVTLEASPGIRGGRGSG